MIASMNPFYHSTYWLVVGYVLIMLSLNDGKTTPRLNEVKSYKKSIQWNKYFDGKRYTALMARADFGMVSNWNEKRATISNGTLRITVEKNALSHSGGMIASIRIPSGTAYKLNFSIRFDDRFEWSRGGKVGFGFGIGNGNTGCKKPIDGAGGSLRVMWHSDTKKNRLYFHPYAYYKTMPGSCGDSFNKTYPISGTIRKNKWYHIYIFIKSNTDSDTNGRAVIKINDEILLDQTIGWTTNKKKQFINRLFFHTFRGGKGEMWKAATDGHIYYDNFNIERIN